jgi:regulatory protein
MCAASRIRMIPAAMPSCAMAREPSPRTAASPDGRPRRTPPPAGPAPTEATLHEAALAHLARFAATEAGLRRVLERRVDRWAHRAVEQGAPAETVAGQAGVGRAAAAVVARRLVAAGAVDDAGFAAARARRLARSGRSRRAIAAHLAAKGVAAETARAALPEDAETAELEAALAWCRRRRAGPFAATLEPGPEAARTIRLKALAALARAGFPRAVAEAALDMDPETAADRLAATRR